MEISNYYNYALDALRALDQPSDIVTICREIAKRFPPESPEDLDTSMGRSPYVASFRNYCLALELAELLEASEPEIWELTELGGQTTIYPALGRAIERSYKKRYLPDIEGQPVVVSVHGEDFWYKVGECYTVRRAVVEDDRSQVSVYFIGFEGTIFDYMTFPELWDAYTALRKFGFWKMSSSSDTPGRRPFGNLSDDLFRPSWADRSSEDGSSYDSGIEKPQLPLGWGEYRPVYSSGSYDRKRSDIIFNSRGMPE